MWENHWSEWHNPVWFTSNLVCFVKSLGAQAVPSFDLLSLPKGNWWLNAWNIQYICTQSVAGTYSYIVYILKRMNSRKALSPYDINSHGLWRWNEHAGKQTRVNRYGMHIPTLANELTCVYQAQPVCDKAKMCRPMANGHTVLQAGHTVGWMEMNGCGMPHATERTNRYERSECLYFGNGTVYSKSSCGIVADEPFIHRRCVRKYQSVNCLEA